MVLAITYQPKIKHKNGISYGQVFHFSGTLAFQVKYENIVLSNKKGM